MDPRDESLLQDLLDDRLDDASAAGVRARLAAEPDLREAWDELRRVRDLVRGAPVERAPPDFLSQVRARIAATQSPTAAPAAPPAEAPRGRLRMFPRQLAVAMSGLAALFLVALGVRWMAASGDRVDRETLVLESARGPDRFETLDRLREDAASGAGSSLPGVRAPAEPTPPPAPGISRGTTPPAAEHATGDLPAPVASRPAPGGFGPGDQVPSNLRTPTDEVAELERPTATPRSAREGKSTGKARRGAPAGPEVRTWILEADDLETGRARLALLVAGLETGRGAQGETVSGRHLLQARQGDGVVLGSVLLCLSADQAAALDPTRADAKRGAVDRRAGAARGGVDPRDDGARQGTTPGDEAEATEKEEADTAPRPGTPAAPGVPSPPVPVVCEPGLDASSAPSEGAEKRDAWRTAGLRVRILLVRSRTPR